MGQFKIRGHSDVMELNVAKEHSCVCVCVCVCVNSVRLHTGISLFSLQRLQRVSCHNNKFCLYCHLAICGGSGLGFEVALFFYLLRSVEQRM